MPLYRVQVRLAMATAAPLDSVVNTWHFIADDEAELLSGAVLQLTTFYAAIDGGLSADVATTGHSLKAYDLADPEPRAPVIDQGIGTLSLGTNTLPHELAVVMSFQAPQQSGVAQARRRGRIYLGPLSAAAATTGGYVSSGHLSTFGGAIQNLLDASQAATTWAWAVYSRTNEAAIEVTNAWIDNAFDVQRRRGTEPTVRTTFV